MDTGVICDVPSRSQVHENAVMGSEARKHHYIPQAYLRGFGWERKKKEWHVHAWDMNELRYFQPNTRKVAVETDFLRVNVPGLAPDCIEREMSGFETKVREAIVRLDQTLRFEGNEREVILNLIALLAVRTPHLRKDFSSYWETYLNDKLDAALSSKERWEAEMARIAAETGIPQGPSQYEDSRAFRERNKRLAVRMPQEKQIAAEYSAVVDLYKVLAQRNWRLYVAEPGTGAFITSTVPVVIYNIDLRDARIPPPKRESGYASPMTEVLFPVSKRCFLRGRFKGEGLDDTTRQASFGFVGDSNTRVMMFSKGIVFSAEKVFPYRIPTGEMYFDDQLVARLKPFKEKHEASKN
jgi:hypothetical protein